MHLMFYTNDKGERVYTLKVRRPTACRRRARFPRAFGSPDARRAALATQKETPEGKPTVSAHPARFSPDDKFSKHRLICKRRFGLLPTQQPAAEL